MFIIFIWTSLWKNLVLTKVKVTALLFSICENSGMVLYLNIWWSQRLDNNWVFYSLKTHRNCGLHYFFCLIPVSVVNCIVFYCLHKSRSFDVWSLSLWLAGLDHKVQHEELSNSELKYHGYFGWPSTCTVSFSVENQCHWLWNDITQLFKIKTRKFSIGVFYKRGNIIDLWKSVCLGDMYDFLTKHEGGLPEDKARDFFQQIVSAITYCHDLHIVHRDLKPENVVLSRNQDVVKITDFGFSNQYTPGTHLRTSCGSLAYSAPEILLGDSYEAAAVG